MQPHRSQIPTGSGNPADDSRILAGAMSGTSADGVDVAIVRIAGHGLQMQPALLAHHHHAYLPPLRDAIFEFRENRVERDALARLARLGRELSLAHAQAVQQALAGAHLDASDLAAVAAHGQTLFHQPPNSIQWLDPALIAAEVGCAVISDFRRADLAAGGQGAPLVPFADFLLFRDPRKSRVMLNLGGIANLTWIPAGATTNDVIAFDTGPANCIVDHLVMPDIDTGGRLASRGRVNKRLLAELRESPYFQRPPPKSTDGPEMISAFETARSNHPDVTRLTDLLATACALTATSIAQAIVRHCPRPVDEVITSGGGTKNVAMMKMLREQLGDVQVRMTDDLGVPSQAKEAMAFVLLGAATLDGIPANVPAATGARRPVVLGCITPRP
jgi:anhydro-N-acetylmuramic acid kinase